MKIIFTRFPLESSFGGAEVQVISLMEGLIKCGHAVAFLGSCPTLLDECKKRNIPFAKLDIGPPPVTKWGAISFFWRKKKMRRLLRQAIQQFHSLDAVIMLSLSEKLLLTPFLINRKPKTKNQKLNVFWLEHDRVGRWLTKNPWLPQLRRLSSKVTTIVVSELSKKIYVDLGWDSERVVAIPNGIDPERLRGTSLRQGYGRQAGNGTRETVRGKWETFTVQRLPFNIGCIARLTPDKGVDLLIEAVKDISDVQLTIVGTGRDENIIKRVTRNAQRVNVIKRVDNIGNFYSSLDLLVLPSREHDPFGLVAAEAMMLGVPVVVTDACGIADYLENGKDAIVVKAGSAKELKSGIEKLLSSKEKRIEISKAGKNTAYKCFAVEQMIDRYEQLLSKWMR